MLSNETEQKPDYSKQKEEAFVILQELLFERNAKDYRENLTELFYGFLKSEEADYKPTRENMMSLHYVLVSFFTKMYNLPLIDRSRNLQ